MGCLNPSSGQNTEFRGLESELIRVPVNFAIRGTNNTYKGVIDAGCTCVTPYKNITKPE